MRLINERFLPPLLFLAAVMLPPASAFPCRTDQYHPQPGLKAAVFPDRITIEWDGEEHQQLRAEFSLRDQVPILSELAISKRAGQWSQLGHDLQPEFGVTTGLRRTGHGLPEERRWDVYWDAPLSVPGAASGNPNLPRNPEEVRHSTAEFHADQCVLKTDGARLELFFPGVQMGIFSGGLQFTVYQGANLLRQEIIASTEEPSVAYKYYGGWKGLSADDLPALTWRDLGGNEQRYGLHHPPNRDPVPLRARHRLLVAGGRLGAIAVFPPPHQFFFARQLEVNLGFVWYREDQGRSYSIGIRHGDTAEGYNPAWIQQVFALYNAPPGTMQRMPVYFYLTSLDANACYRGAMAYTHNDTYKPLPGFKTMVTHFHVAFTQELMAAGSLDIESPWIPAMRALGINIAHIFDFHGDGHPRDPGPVRFRELQTYFEGCQRHSDENFLILPGEEANVYLGGHYNILFPKPVFWTHVRPDHTPPSEEIGGYGTVYHVRDAAELFRLIQEQHALVWQTHPRTKGSTFYPDKIRETDYFQSDRWLGAGFKAMPVDLSQKRLGEIRCFGTLDDMNNWGGPKFLVGEVDTYKKFPEYDLYGDFNVNYLQLSSLPLDNNWRPITEALRAGRFFVTTGEVLIPHWQIDRRAGSAELDLVADVEWTFPLEFVEAVWGDGTRIDRKSVSGTSLPPFGRKQFRIPIPGGKKWIRFAAWDSAGNGAFTQPVHLLPSSYGTRP